jgi:hypothetical protein
LDGAALAQSFIQIEPVRLSGELASWRAAVIAYYALGPSPPDGHACAARRRNGELTSSL